MKTALSREHDQACVQDASHEIEHYERQVPDFVAEEIDRCYAAMHASLSYLRIAGDLTASTCTYVARSNGMVRSLFLFERKGPDIHVLNSGITTGQEEVGRFADYIFKELPGISRIVIPGVHTEKLQTTYPYQRFFCGEDIVVSCAGTAAEYERQLGKGTRKNIRRRAAELQRQHPSSRYSVVPGASIDAEMISTIIGWNRERMCSKNKVSSYQGESLRRYTAMAADDGFVVALKIDDRMCAASMCCRVGNSYYMTLIGHDSKFDEFSPGLLCCYWAALECLRREAKEINMMGGRIPYKFNLLGLRRRYDCLTIYRNRKVLLHNLRDVMRTALRGYLVEAKFALLDYEYKDGGSARMIRRALGIWRASKNVFSRMRPVKAS